MGQSDDMMKSSPVNLSQGFLLPSETLSNSVAVIVCVGEENKTKILH